VEVVNKRARRSFYIRRTHRAHSDHDTQWPARS